MGESATLSEFLEYSHKNFPADRYALIMWDHGNGPVMGYGKDTKYKNDALLLKEMSDALNDSPFNGENKLAFVGFDACLMASAELAVVFSDYADFMISSQEIEPFFGWNYSFFKDITHPDVKEVAKRLSKNYLDTCNEYYEEREYENRDTTISCMDLSYADELSLAIDALFEKAGKDAYKKYDTLASKRVNTRALGRASTGSEYDLIDLADMAKQMQKMYADESKALCGVIEKMTVCNVTNTVGCCGMSIYYPFYNKNYYENSWSEIYSELGLFPEYQNYLESYAKTWLGNDKVKDNASSGQMEQSTDGKYQLKLTSDQQQTFASAKYYVFQKETDSRCRLVFLSSDVTNKDGTLTANFDGKAIYVQNKYNEYFIPVMEHCDTVDSLLRYQTNLTVSKVGFYDYLMSGDESSDDFKDQRWQFTLDKEKEKVSVSSVVNTDGSGDGFSGGKTEDAESEDWNYIFQAHGFRRYVTRDQNGVILPYSQWTVDTNLLSSTSFRVDGGFELTYEPLDNGSYYILIEVQDTQGNGYCSELMEIEVSGTEREAYQIPVNEVEWKSGDEVLLTDKDGVEVYLTTVKDDFSDSECYTLKAVNNSENKVEISLDNVVCNGNIVCRSSCYLSGESYEGIEPGETYTGGYFSGIDFGGAEKSGELGDVKSIDFDLTVQDAATGVKQFEEHYTVGLSEKTMLEISAESKEYADMSKPFMGYSAKRQKLYDKDGLKITLVGISGKEGDETELPKAIILAENTSDKAIAYDVCNFVINGVFVGSPSIDLGLKVLPAECREYIALECSAHEFEPLDITAVDSVSIFAVRDYKQVDGYFTGENVSLWLDIKADKTSASATKFKEQQKVIYDKDGIRLAVGEVYEEDGNAYVKMSLYNGTDKDISVTSSSDGVADSTGVFFWLGAKAGQYSADEVDCKVKFSDFTSTKFKIRIEDIRSENILFDSKDIITVSK